MVMIAVELTITLPQVVVSAMNITFGYGHGACNQDSEQGSYRISHRDAHNHVK